MTTPRVTQLTPERKILCLRLLSTASRKMPPTATLAPRLLPREISMEAMPKIETAKLEDEAEEALKAAHHHKSLQRLQLVELFPAVKQELLPEKK
jgi:hypothetical protein